MKSLKKLFLDFEGNNWFNRNKYKIKKKQYYNDQYSKEIINIIKKTKGNIKILDIGASDGSRLKYIKKKLKKKKIQFYGLEPSKDAIKNNYDKKINIKLGTADKIPFKKKNFNIILFSFCLYLCDTDLLSKVTNETIRTLKKNSFIIIFDFYSKKTVYKKYKHFLNTKIRKMDNSKIFKKISSIKLLKEKIISYNLFYKIYDKNSKTRNNKLAIHVFEKIKDNL